MKWPDEEPESSRKSWRSESHEMGPIAQLKVSPSKRLEILWLEGREWSERAECNGMGSDHFYPQKGQSSWIGRKTCFECPVALECLQYAIDNGETEGIWAGLVTRKRDLVREMVKEGAPWEAAYEEVLRGEKTWKRWNILNEIRALQEIEYQQMLEAGTAPGFANQKGA